MNNLTKYIVLILEYRYYILVSMHQPDKGGGGHHHTHCTHNQNNSPAMESLQLWLGAAQGSACSCPGGIDANIRTKPESVIDELCLLLHSIATSFAKLDRILF